MDKDEKLQEREGTYMARAVASSARWSWTENNNPELALDFRIELAKGKMHVETLYFVLAPARDADTKSSADIVIEQLRACGWRGVDIRKLDGVDANLVKVRAKLNVFDGRTSLKWTVLTGNTRKEPMSQAELDKFAGDMRLYMNAGAEGSGANHLQQEREPGID